MKEARKEVREELKKKVKQKRSKVARKQGGVLEDTRRRGVVRRSE